MRFGRRKWKAIISWMLIVAMLGGYGNTALAAGIQGEAGYTAAQEGSAGAQTDTGAPSEAGSESGQEETGTVPGDGTEEEKPSEGESVPKEDADPPAEEEEPSNNTDSEGTDAEELVSGTTEEILAASQQTRVYQPYWENPNFTNLVVFVDFADTTHEHPEHAGYDGCYKESTEATFRYFNGSEEEPLGMRQYLYNISYGQLRVENVFPQYDEETKAITPYRLSNNGSYYAQNEPAMVTEIIQKLNSSGQLPTNVKLDLEGNQGILDNLMIVVPCDNGNSTDFFVGHKTTYAGNDNKIAGNLVRDYTVVTEAGIYFSIHNAGLIVHEFLHSLGYPDLYRSGSGGPVVYWDIMATESYRLQYPLAYLRSSITKWFDISTVTESQTGVSLYAASATTNETKDRQALILKTDYSDTEFFVVEYRKKGAVNEYEQQLPGSGLIIYRVNTNVKDKTNITGPPDFIYLFRPNDEYGEDGYEKGKLDNIWDAYLSLESKRTSYGSSDSKASLSEGAITYSDGTNSGIEISNVGSAGGDQITFDITFHDMGETWKTVAREEEGAGTSAAAYCMGADGRLYALLKKGMKSSSPVSLYECKDGRFVKLGDAPTGSDHKLIEYGGALYTAYLDGYYKVWLARWNGSAWENLYTSPRTAAAGGVCLASDNQGVYLAYQYAEGGNTQIFAVGYTESGISDLGSQVSSNDKGAANPSIAAENGNIVITYRESMNSSRICVKQYRSDSKSWEDVGNLSLKADLSASSKVEINGNKIYLMTYQWQFSKKEAYVYVYDLEGGGSWEQVGENAYFDSSVGEMALCFDGEEPYIVYTVGKEPWGTEVKRLQDNQWTGLGTSVARENTDGLYIFAYKGCIYTAYRNTESSCAVVRRYGSEREEEEELIWQDTVEVSNPFQDLIERTKNGGAKEDGIAAYQAGQYVDSFGGQIENALAKEIYDLLVDRYAVNRLTGNQEAELENIISFPAKTQVVDGKTQLVADASSMAAVAQFVQCFQLAFGAFYMDYPSVYWMQGMSLSYGMKYSSETRKAYITDIVLKPGKEYYEGASGQISVYDAAVQGAKAEIEAEMDASGKDKGNRYQLVKAIHRYLCGKLSYDTAAGNNLGGEGYGYAHTSSTVFLGHNGKYEVVCEGYAKAFKVLCEQWKIPCTLVIGQGGIPGNQGPHMWNYVQMEDGQWYGMDVTWNDQDNGMRLEYFLAGSNTPGFDYGGIAFPFAEEHEPDMEIMTGLLYPFVYPDLAKEKYGYHDIIREDENGKWLIINERDAEEAISEKDISVIFRKNQAQAPFDGISILDTDEKGTFDKKLKQSIINEAVSLLKNDGELELGFWENGSSKLTRWHLQAPYKARRDYNGTVTAVRQGSVWSLTLSDENFPADQVWVSYGEPGLASYQEAEDQGPRTIYYYTEVDGERELAGQGEYEHIPAEESEFGELHILNLYDVNGLKPGTAYLAETSRSDWRLEYGYTVDEKGEEIKGTVEYYGSEEALIAALGSKSVPGGNIRIACTGEEQPESIPAGLLDLCGQKNWNLEYIRREDTAGVSYVWNWKGLKTGNEAFALDVVLSTQEEDLPVEFRERTYIQVEPKGNLPEGASVFLTIRQEGIAARFGDEGLLRLWKREGGKLTFRGTAKPDPEGNWISFALKEPSGTVYIISSQAEYGWQMVRDKEGDSKEQAVYIENRSGLRVTGWEIVEGRKCYFNEKGYLIQGPAKVDGVWYLFGYYVGNTWGIRTGIVLDAENGKTYYANAEGKLQKGWQKIGEIWHYFSQEEDTFGQEVPSSQEGYWVTMEGHRYYFRSNKSLLKNWQTIDGKRYFFTQEGYAQTGWYPNPAEKNAYYLNELGERQTGYIRIRPEQEGKEAEGYFFHTNGVRQYGWQRIPDAGEEGGYRWRYFNPDPDLEKYAYGQEITSEPKGDYWYEMEGETYYFTKNARLATGWQTVDGKRYYFDGQGKMNTGTQKIGSAYYHFYESGEMKGVLGTGLFEDGKNTYYANGSGVLQRGWQKIDGEWRFFRQETGAEEEGSIQTNYWAVVTGEEGRKTEIFYFLNGTKIATGWQTIEGRRYYFDGNGVLKTGFFTVGKNVYYGREADDLADYPGEVLAGEQNIDGGTYYFGSNYEMYTGWQKIDNVWRYFSTEETSPARGKEKQTSGPEIEETWYWYTVGDQRYCFRNNTALLKGWQTINGERYYLDPVTGAAAVGTSDAAVTLKIGNYVYCFNEKGVMQKDTVVDGFGYNAKGYRVSGWQKLDNRWHYFDASDTKNPDTWREVPQTESGRGSYWVTLDFGGERGEETYYFRNNSSMVKNWQTIDGQRYYFDPKTGALQTGNADGLYFIGSNAYYLGTDGALRYGWIKEKTYYANSSGVLQSSWQKIDNLWYYFSREDRKRDIHAKIGLDYFATAHEGEREETYYFVKGTSLAKGWQTIHGTRYYFDTSTNVLQTGFFQVGKAWYCFREDHQPQTGWWRHPDTQKYYYFNAGGQALTGWQTIQGNRYYFDANGVMQTQRTKIGNTWYFFGPDGKMRTGFVKYCDTTYYFKANGQMLTGWQTIEGQRYYFNRDGALQTGFVQIGKGTYYFDEKRTALGQMLKGEQRIGDSTYFFNNSGVLQYGWQKLDYVWRFFDPATGAERNVERGADDWRTIVLSETETARSFINNGSSVLKGWQTIEGKRYYFDTDGILWTHEKGWLTIGKNRYYFKEEDDSVFRGFLELDGSVYYLNANGQMLTGWQTVKEGTVSSKYYLDPVSGEAWIGHRQIGKNWYYFDPADHGKMAVGYIQDADQEGYYYNGSGVRQTGWQKIDGAWKYFAPENGKECAVTVGEDYWATVAVGENQTERAYLKGGMKVLTGWQTINEKRYYFDSNGFQWTAEKGWLTVGKNKFYFDESQDNAVYQGFLELPDKNGKTHMYYLNANGQMLTGWQTITLGGVKEKYYLDPADGEVWMGHRKIGNNWYYFDPAAYGKMAVGYIQDADQDWYYYNSGGVLLTGWQKPDKAADYHYFDPAGDGDGNRIGVERRLKEKEVWTVVSGRNTDTYDWYTVEEQGCAIDGVRYCFKNNASLLKKGQSIDGKYYWFHSSTGALYTGYFGIGQNRYRAYDGSEEGHTAGEVFTGFGPVGPDSEDIGYYDSHGQRVTGWQTIPDENGNDGKYYFNANGVRLEGIQWIGSARYLFREGENGAGQLIVGSDSLDSGTGRADIAGVGTCYADKDGKLKTGWNRFAQNGDYVWKYLSEDTGAEQTVAVDPTMPEASGYVWYQVTEGENTGTYCIYNNQTVLKKYQNIGGGRYYFDASSGKLKKGWFLAGTDHCYSDTANGEIQSGRQQIDSDWYYLNGDGKLQTGWQTIKDADGTLAKYYFDENGILQTGFQKIGKFTYYLSEDTNSEDIGAMQTGLVTIANGRDDGTYYFNGKGEMQTGWISIDVPEEEIVWKYFGADGKEIEPEGTPGSMPPAIRPGSTSDEAKIDESYRWYQIGEDWYCIQNQKTPVKGLSNLTGGYRYFFDRTTGALVKGSFTDKGAHYYSDISTGVIDPAGCRVLEIGNGRYTFFDGNGKRRTGWVKWGDEKYYCDPSDGQAVCGFVKIGKQDYYFDPYTGELQKNATNILEGASGSGQAVLYYTGTNEYLLSGLQSVNGKWYYFDSVTKEGQEAAAAPEDGKNGWVTLKNGIQYYLKNGKPVTGWQTVEADGVKGRYYFDSQGILQKGWVNDGTKRYYMDENTGKAVTGFMTFVDGVRYFDANGQMKTGWIALPDNNNSKIKHNYYCNANGILLKGICWIDNKQYVLDPNTGERAGKESFGWIEITDIRYYANDNGTLKTGWQKAGGKSYYYGTDGQLVTGWKTIDGKTYYFDADGAMLTGYQAGPPVSENAAYYFNNNGVLQTGWARVPENKQFVWRFFGADGKEILPRRVRDTSPKGETVKGYRWYQVNTDWYCIQNDKTVQKGFVNIGSWRYYFDTVTGALVKGHFSDAKGQYYSDPVTGAINRSGYKLEETIRGKREISYFDKNGKRVTGWMNLGENRYYFDTSDGHAVSGLVRIGKQDYYFDPESKALQKSVVQKNAVPVLIQANRDSRTILYYTGKGEYLLSGWQKVDGSWYYFDAETKEGEQSQIVPGRDGNWVSLSDGSQYYFKAGKTLAKDWQTISVNGESGRYYFDGSGVLRTGWIGIKDKRYYTDTVTDADEGTVAGRAANNEFLYFADGICQRVKPETGIYDTYYFDKNGLMKTGWITLTGSDKVKRSYYFNSNGEMRKGLCWIGKDCYVLDPDTGLRIENGSVQIDGKVYYANSKGILKTGWEKISGKSYYYGTDGQRSSGWREIDGKLYYFDAEGVMLTGYQPELPVPGTEEAAETAAYYLNGSGVMQTGWFLLDVPEEGKVWKYFSADGREIVPDAPVNVTPAGEESKDYRWYRVEGNWYCIDKNNKVLKGSNKIGSFRYYFDAAAGALQKGHFTVGTTPYYSDPDTGAVNVNGLLYTELESGDIFYYDGNGKQVTGWVTIPSGEHAGKYYFHTLTGAAYRGGWYYVDNVPCLFDVEGKVREVPVISSVKMNHSGVVTVGWKEVPGIKRYVLEYAKDASFTTEFMSREIEDSEQTFLTLTGLDLDARYYFRLKYVLENREGGEEESVYSKVKNIDIAIQGSVAFQTLTMEKDLDGNTRMKAEFQVKGRIKSYENEEGQEDGNYYLVRVNSYNNQILSEEPLYAVPKDQGMQKGENFFFEFQIPLPEEWTYQENELGETQNASKLQQQEVVMSKYALAVKSSENREGKNEYKVISPGMYVDNPEFTAEYQTPYFEAASKKGIQGALPVYSPDLGTKQTLWNLNLRDVLREGPDSRTITYRYKGKTYYFADLIDERNRVKEYIAGKYGHKMSITMVLLCSYPKYSYQTALIHPSARQKGAAPYYTLNSSTLEGQELYEAMFSYLGEVFGQDDCYVSNWVLGNEVNSCNAWNYTGSLSFSEYMKCYTASFRQLYYGVKTTRASSRVFISLDNAWTRAVAGYAGKSVLNSFASQMYSEATNVKWNLAFHPYSAPLTRTDFWNDGSNTTNSVNSPFISMRNLNYLSDYLTEVENQYGRGQEDIRVILSEQGWTSSGYGERTQAEAIARAYYIAEFNSRVDAFIIRAEIDDWQEMQSGLYMGLKNFGSETKKTSSFVYKYMDTPLEIFKAKNVYEFKLDERNISRFKEAQVILCGKKDEVDWNMWTNQVSGFDKDRLNSMPAAKKENGEP